MRKLTTAMICGAALILCASTVMAEHPKERKGFELPRDLDKAIDHFEMLIMWRMMDALDLDKATAQKVFAIRRKFTEEQKTTIKELGTEMEELRSLLQEDTFEPNEKELSRIVTSIRDKRRRLESLRDRQYDEISHVLTLVQQAQLLIFTKDFQDEIRAFIRQPMMPPPGPPPAGMPPPPSAGVGTDPFAGPPEF
jgi:Spy/CpxP family protein refolding chaperone